MCLDEMPFKEAVGKGWHYLMLEFGIGPQQNLKKRQKIVSTLDVFYAHGHLQTILHEFK